MCRGPHVNICKVLFKKWFTEKLRVSKNSQQLNVVFFKSCSNEKIKTTFLVAKILHCSTNSQQKIFVFLFPVDNEKVDFSKHNEHI
jgi:hypothetical protein